MVEGPRGISAALDNEAVLDELLVVGGAEPELVLRAREAGADITYVDGDQLERALTTRTPQPVVAVASRVVTKAGPLITLALESGLPLVVLAGVSDPGNAGTVIRSAAAAGAAGVLVTEGSVDPFNPKCVRATAGALFVLPVGIVADLPAALTGTGLRLVGATSGGVLPDAAELGGPMALVLGGEAAGIAPEIELALDETVALPLEPGVESLNVAMAATALLYEARRQRRGGGW